MCLPPKVVYATEAEYCAHFARVYCSGPILTSDGIPVYFRKDKAKHCLYESSKRDGVKDKFSPIRAERLDWIKATLQNPAATLYKGWDRRRKKIDEDSRVAVVYEDFVVIIRMIRGNDGSVKKAFFVMAYEADNSIGKIRSMPRWEK